jgi:glycosyltransferase involved in cell wall biosynthesis
MENPDKGLISVIIPTIGRTTLGRAVDSVLGQSAKETEIIIVNDGPFDIDMEQRMIRTNRPFSGPAAARNIGISAASGGIICFLDDDDEFINPDGLEFQRSVIMEKGCPWVSGLVLHKPGDKPAGISVRLKSRFFEASLKHVAFHVSSVAFRKDFLEKVGPFNEKLKIAEDYEFFLRCLLHGEPETHNTVISKRWVSAGGISADQEKYKSYAIMALKELLGHARGEKRKMAERELALREREWRSTSGA